MKRVEKLQIPLALKDKNKKSCGFVKSSAKNMKFVIFGQKFLKKTWCRGGG